MYNNNVESNATTLDMKDIKQFKNQTLIFALCNLGALILSLAKFTLFGSIINWIGSFVFIYGIYTLSNKYSGLASGKKVVSFYLISIVIDMGSTLFNTTMQEPQISSGASLSELSNAINQYYSISFILMIMLIIFGGLTFFTTKYFTEWFNLEFGKFEQTKAFYYYGLISLIGQVFLGFGIFALFNSLKSAVADPYNFQISSITSILLISGLGALLVFVSIFALVVASFTLYNKLDSWTNGKYTNPQPNFKYQQQLPYQQQSPYQQNTQNANSETGQFKNNNPSFDVKYCTNCGTKMQSFNTYCGNCGTKI